MLDEQRTLGGKTTGREELRAEDGPFILMYEDM